MRILIHDYAGHPFQLQLSRCLAKRGHDVIHIYSASNLTPQGAVERKADDVNSFEIIPIKLSQQINKKSLLKRRKQEIQHGKYVSEQIAAFRPEYIISANTPLDSQVQIYRASRRINAKFVIWLQDLIGIGTHCILSRKYPGIGHIIGKYYMRLEKALLYHSDKIVVISEDLIPFLSPDNSQSRISVVHNWAPVSEIPIMPKDNKWAQQWIHDPKPRFLFSGTLALKHNPAILLELAKELSTDKSANLFVISEGVGADWLRIQNEHMCLPSLNMLPFQPYDQLPLVLASADILVAILEPDAGIFSVPSKVLTYLCAGKPLLLAVPPENLSARIVSEANAGIVVHPDNIAGFIEGAHRLLADGDLRARMGANARKYAEEHFNIEQITDRWEAILQNTNIRNRK
jgi:colanic acid biosynthesis glycosyl transferase WcaI